MTTASHAAPAPEIFKAYDIRGIVGKTLTPETVQAIGHALGSEAVARGQKAIAVGRDGRLSGPELAGALAEGIRAAGVDVIDVGCVPTPLTYFAAYHLDTHSCVSVTGSHNPPDYNGLKMVLGGQTLFGELIQALRSRIIDGNLVTAATPGKLTQANVVPAYIERIAGDVKLARPMKVVMDCGNGVAGAVAPELFRRLGCELVELFCEVDGNFPNHHPDPSKPENLEDVIRALKDTDAELGLAFDGDGDRLGVVTKDGEIIFPDRQLMLFAEDVLTRVPGGEIIYDVKCTRNLAGWIRERGGKPTMWNTGHALVKALPNAVCTPELNLKMAEGEPFELVRRLKEAAPFPGAESVLTIDGVRVEYADGFGLARPSNTTPVVVLRFEADTPEAIARIQDDFRHARSEERRVGKECRSR